MQTCTLGRGTGKSWVRVRVALSQPAGYPCSCLVVVVVVHRPFDLRRPCRCHCPVGCLVIRSSHCRHQLSPTLSSSSSSVGHLPCGGLVLVVIWWGPHPRPRHPQVICPAEASLPLLSDGGLLLVVIIIICSSFLLQGPRPHHCHCQSSPYRRHPVGASPSSSVLADHPCRVVVVVVVMGPD